MSDMPCVMYLVKENELQVGVGSNGITLLIWHSTTLLVVNFPDSLTEQYRPIIRYNIESYSTRSRSN